MPIRLRFALHGTRNNRILHLVAINSRRARNAAPAELLGIYDPRLPATISPDGTRRTPNTYNVKENPARTVRWSVDRIRYWLSVGAVPSKSVARLLQAGGILGHEGKRIIPEGVSIHAFNTTCSRCGVEGHAVRDCEQPPEKVEKKIQVNQPASEQPPEIMKEEKVVVEEKQEKRKEPTGQFASLLKSSREFIAASSTSPTPPTHPVPVLQDRTTTKPPPQGQFADLIKSSRDLAAASPASPAPPTNPVPVFTTKPPSRNALLADIVPPSRSPLAGFTIDSLSSMSEDEITILFTFWEEWENARLARIRARRAFEEEAEGMDENHRAALQKAWDEMGPEPDIFGYNILPDDSDSKTKWPERYALYEKKDIEREFEKIRDHTTPASKFVPSTLSRKENERLEQEWKDKRAAEFLEEKIRALKVKPVSVDEVAPDLEALFRDVKGDVDLERQKEFVLEQALTGKRMKD